MIIEDLFLVRDKGMTKHLAYALGIIIAGLIVIVYALTKGIIPTNVVTEDIMISSAKDISTYVTTLSAFDAGMQTYSLPKEMNVVVKNNFVQLSSGSIAVSSEFSGNVKETSFTSKKICIVKNIVAGQGEMYICDVGNFECCNPKIE